MYLTLDNFVSSCKLSLPTCADTALAEEVGSTCEACYASSASITHYMHPVCYIVIVYNFHIVYYIHWFGILLCFTSLQTELGYMCRTVYVVGKRVVHLSSHTRLMQVLPGHPLADPKR